MLRRLALVPLALAALVALPACDSGGPDAIGVTGTWEGEVYDPAVADAPRYPIELRLTDSGVRVVGTGSVELTAETVRFDVTDGTFFDGNLRLELQFDRAPFLGGITGVLVNEDPGRIEGTMSGTGEAGGEFVIEITSRRV